MASFQLRRESDDIIVTLNVGEFIFRNTYGTNSVGVVSSLEPSGFTSITKVGDNVYEKLGRERIESHEKFYFVNHPDYYIMLDGNLTVLYDATTQKDPTDNNDVSNWRYTHYYGVIYIYKNNNKLTPFINYHKITRRDNGVLNPPEILSPTIPNFFRITQDVAWNPRIIYNFTQKQIGYLSPFYYRMQTFNFPKTFSVNSGAYYFGSATPIYMGSSFTIKNQVPNTSTAQAYYLKNGDVFNISLIKNYNELSNQEIICTANGYNASTPTFYIRSYSSNIDLKTPYDFWYWLLNDTDSSDEPYPDNDSNKDPSGQSPPTTGGNPSGGNIDSDDILTPTYPTINPINTGSVNLYEMDGATFRDFMSYLWTNTFFTTIIKLFQNPMDAVISAHILGIAAPTVRTDYITIGNVTTTVQAQVVRNNFTAANFSYIDIPEFYQDASDYIDTVIELYLPYYGYVTLNPLEVMGARINLLYTIDVLTGAFVAFITVTKTTDGTTLNSVLYQYNGNMAYQIPLSSVDYSTFVTAAINAVGALSHKKISKVTDGLVNAALGIEIEYDRAGSLSSNVGYMSVKEAYVTILRPIHNQPPNFAKYLGYPYEGYVNLGSCSGYTKCREVFIDTVIGTEQETAQIKAMLLQGVIF